MNTDYTPSDELTESERAIAERTARMKRVIQKELADETEAHYWTGLELQEAKKRLVKLEALAHAARELRQVDMDPDVTGHKTALYRAIDELDGNVATACCPHEASETGTFTDPSKKSVG